MSQNEQLRLPRLIEGGRQRSFALLLGVSIVEVGAQVAAAGVLKALLVGVTSGTMAISLLIATGLGAALCAWAREVMGERLGLDYVNHVRQALARHALTMASTGGPGRFGTIAIRMTGDLSALKDWASRGVCGGVAGLLGLAGAIYAAWWTAGWAGLAATLAGPVFAFCIGIGLTPLLLARIRQRRKQRGRLSAKIGDMLLGASAAVGYGAEARIIRPVDRAGREILEAQTRQVSVSSLMRLPVLLTLPVGAAVAVYLSGLGYSPTGGVAGWAALLFSLSLAGLAVSHLVGAVEQTVERRVAVAKLRDLLDVARASAQPKSDASMRLRTGPGLSLKVSGRKIVGAGVQVEIYRHAADWLEDVLSAAPTVCVGGKKASRIRAIDWPRRVAYAGPARGLHRGRLDDVLAAKRKAPAQAIVEALELVDLPGEWTEHPPMIDPQSPSFSESIQARLRLARALVHGPRILIIDDPWLTVDETLIKRVQAWCQTRPVSLIHII